MKQHTQTNTGDMTAKKDAQGRFMLNKVMSGLVIVGAMLAAPHASAQYINLDQNQGTGGNVNAPLSKGSIGFGGMASSNVTSISAQEVVSLKPTETFKAGMLTQIGVPKGAVDQVKGFGKSLPLVDALKVVVPKGWYAKKSGEVDVQKPVSFSGNKNWVETAAGFAEQAGVSMVVDWDQQLLTVVGPEKQVQMQSVGIIRLMDEEKEGKATAAAAVESSAVAKVASAGGSGIAPLAPMKRWDLTSGKSLRDNVEAWAASATPKYKVSWQAVNYMISADAAFEGGFDDETKGPITQLFQLFANHDVPLKATFMEDNRVLVVENTSYRQNAKEATEYTRSADVMGATRNAAAKK
jgi:Toxin co-regulated pilus biosynthesis protein Q